MKKLHLRCLKWILFVNCFRKKVEKLFFPSRLDVWYGLYTLATFAKSFILDVWNRFHSWTIFVKSTILDAWHGFNLIPIFVKSSSLDVWHDFIRLLFSCVCLCVRVCVCVYVFFHREGFFRLQNAQDIIEGTDQQSCVVNISWLRYAKFHHLRIWKCHISPPKTKTPAEPLLERKRYDIMCAAKWWYILIQDINRPWSYRQVTKHAKDKEATLI